MYYLKTLYSVLDDHGRNVNIGFWVLFIGFCVVIQLRKKNVFILKFKVMMLSSLKFYLTDLSVNTMIRGTEVRFGLMYLDPFLIKRP
jgi:hypothetical protein